MLLVVSAGTAEGEREGSAVVERVWRRVRGGARRDDEDEAVAVAVEVDVEADEDEEGWTETARRVVIGILGF